MVVVVEKKYISKINQWKFADIKCLPKKWQNNQTKLLMTSIKRKKKISLKIIRQRSVITPSSFILFVAVMLLAGNIPQVPLHWLTSYDGSLHLGIWIFVFW